MVITMSDGGPERIQLVPDDYHTQHVGVTPDGRQVFVTEGLFAILGPGEMVYFAAAFVWSADGVFQSLTVRDMSRPQIMPPGQSGSSGTDVAQTFIDELGGIELTPISVAPFATDWDGITFGLIYLNADGYERVELHPGNSIALSEPWDGFEYDT